jgi:hypothetical protein
MYNVKRHIIKIKFLKFWATYFNEDKISWQKCKDMCNPKGHKHDWLVKKYYYWQSRKV